MAAGLTPENVVTGAFGAVIALGSIFFGKWHGKKEKGEDTSGQTALVATAAFVDRQVLHDLMISVRNLDGSVRVLTDLLQKILLKQEISAQVRASILDELRAQGIDVAGIQPHS